MSKYTLCDICKTELAKAKHWWEEYYMVGAVVEHIFADGYSSDRLKEEIHLCPDCWAKFLAFVGSDTNLNKEQS